MHVRRIQAPVPEPTFTIEGLTSMQLAVLADALRNHTKQNTNATPIYDEVHRHLKRHWADIKQSNHHGEHETALIRRNAPKVTFTIDCDEQEMEFIKQGLDDGVWTEGDAEEEVLTALQSEVKRATATPAPAKKKR